MILYAQDKEAEERRWREWVSFAPFASLRGQILPYDPQLPKHRKSTAASDDDIKKIAEHYNLDLTEGGI